VPFAGFICDLLKSQKHRKRDLLTCFLGQYILLHVPATPQLGKHSSVGPALRCLNLQLKRARKLFAVYDISLSKYAMPAGARLPGGFAALVVVGHTSSHSLKEFIDTSGGHDCSGRVNS